MKRIVISGLEKIILVLFLASLFPQFLYLKLGCTSLVALYAFGMLFEFTTADAWNYNSLLNKSTFTVRDRDVNWVFGLGWQATLIFALALGKFATESMLPGGSLLHDAVGLFIAGNILEQTFLLLKLYRYNRKHWMVTLGTGKPVLIGGIPLLVRAGYFVMGLGIHALVSFTEGFGCG